MLSLNVTLANLDCSQADDDDRIILSLESGREIVVKQCGHDASLRGRHNPTRYCASSLLTSFEVYSEICRLSGAHNSDHEFHAGIMTATKIGGIPLIVPTVNGFVLSEFGLSETITEFVPTTIQELKMRRGLSLAAQVY